MPLPKGKLAPWRGVIAAAISIVLVPSAITTSTAAAVATARGSVAISTADAVAAQPPFVMVTSGGGQGSGFHVGRGIYMTAAHVVANGGDLTIIAEDGTAKPARIVRIFPKTDVAVLSAAPWVESVPVSCEEPARGLHVTLHGNPMGEAALEFRGYVAGAARPSGGHPRLLPLDVTVLPGASGGAITNDAGEVVGMANAVKVAPTVPSGFLSITGFGWAVPGDLLCEAIESGKAALSSKTAR